MLGTLDSVFFALIAVIMRHIKPKAKETRTRMSINTKGSGCYHWCTCPKTFLLTDRKHLSFQKHQLYDQHTILSLITTHQAQRAVLSSWLSPITSLMHLNNLAFREEFTSLVHLEIWKSVNQKCVDLLHIKVKAEIKIWEVQSIDFSCV